MNSLSDIVAKLEQANANFEAAKAAEIEAVSKRKAASLAQREAQADFNDAVNALKKKRSSPKKEKAAKPAKPAATKKAAA